MKRLKRVVLAVVPEAAIDWYRQKRYGKAWFDPKDRSVANVFTQIYRRKVWGGAGEAEPFNSGPGSAQPVAEPYVAAVHKLIDEHSIKSVVDLGCGDFRVGKLLARPDIEYCGVDVVPDLVAYNTTQFANDKIAFRQANLITDELPQAQLCLIRQVLQHLSNEQVNTILQKCKSYPFLVVTEHLPDPSKPWQPNLDIGHGNETRVDARRSGLVLDAPPFNIAVQRTLCDVVLPDATVIRTVLIVNDAAKPN